MSSEGGADATGAAQTGALDFYDGPYLASPTAAPGPFVAMHRTRGFHPKLLLLHTRAGSEGSRVSSNDTGGPPAPRSCRFVSAQAQITQGSSPLFAAALSPHVIDCDSRGVSVPLLRDGQASTAPRPRNTARQATARALLQTGQSYKLEATGQS
ncbi:uncharacterized protein B0I36DRAFT_344039 [Microdochium trichocladiopsis]|uniref:Uncharacterized protein n=1 Tax=Microdochium trichocladiopsis TaxID=1682393 RepID=A0A9P8YJP3_9PEZI|nr:uncharacterized protein B0I36DRAFT_344039 [Microdochium trichocladiopsis]KAH7040269.1 hypothetical protein B0I36DRAFT_344039 [Microdochium trichocladiopsis]